MIFDVTEKMTEEQKEIYLQLKEDMITKDLPFDVRKFANKLGIRTYSSDHMAFYYFEEDEENNDNDWDKFYVLGTIEKGDEFREYDYTLVVKKNYYYDIDKNFARAHLLYYFFYEKESLKRKTVCSSSLIMSEISDFEINNNYNANNFALELLIPTDIFLKYITKTKERNENPSYNVFSEENINTVCYDFGISREVLTAKIFSLGFMDVKG